MSSILKSLENRQNTETTGDIHSKTINRTVIIQAGQSVVVWALLVGALIGICLTVVWIKALDNASQSNALTAETVPVSEGPSPPSLHRGDDATAVQQSLNNPPVTQRLSPEDFLPVVTEASLPRENPKPELALSPGPTQHRETKTATSRQPAHDKSIPPSTDLPFEVTEIVYEQGGSANLAVVNGLPVMEGTQVDGVLLTEIHADHLVFLVDGQKVKLPLLTPSD
ncbi:MAG: hypothetical protein JRD88_03540 [Deltaproteobacteria bacterium]|jgi:hypothetical protein|nr:hypothetical protein [Deltaproteobacteria bacterium]